MRLTLTGTPPRHWQILRDAKSGHETVAILRATPGDLWIDKLCLDLAPPAADRDTAAQARNWRTHGRDRRR